MASRLTTEILINLAGNLTAKARQYGANMSEFARRNERAMSVVKATTAAAGRGLDALGNRYTGMIAGFAGGAMLREFAQTDRRITRMGLAAEKTRAEMAQIFSGIQDSAIKFRVDDSEVTSAVEKIGTVTGDIDFGVKNKDNLAASIAASGGTGESIGGLFAQFPKFQVTSEKQTLEAMDTLNKLGKEGAFELKDIAEKGVRAFSMYSAAGGKGVKGIKDVGVAMESAIDATGDRDTAATAVENLIRDLQAPKVVKELGRNGINVFGNDGKMRSLPQLMEEVAKRSGNKGAKEQNKRLVEAGFNQDSILLLSSVTTGKGAENLKRYNGVVADGSGILSDAKYAAQDFTSAMTSLNVTWKKFTNSNLAKPVQELADALNSVDQETVQRWLEIGKNITIAVGGIIAARKAFQLGKGALDILGVGKGKGIPKGVSDVFGSGVMPVYVVNMGKGGIGGPGDFIPNEPGYDPKNQKPRGRFGNAFSAIGTTLLMSSIPYLDEEPNISDNDKAGMIKWAQDRAKGPSVWDKVLGWFSSAGNDPQITDPRPWASLQPQNQSPTYPAFTLQPLKGEIRVVVEGEARVKSVKMDRPGITLSAQSGVSNVEQN
ncbi:phage tail tape measure protein [Citrobacter freundii]|uniref:phage tail tape measure protein n=2 Tax=Enterobacterales TaxID=91347 RepID=UPI000BE53922|nr:MULTISPECIES: phage tail tape measure protein [Enterobacteriaceae]MDU1182128.1 phage tail tape measure protein [Citrobacter sp.]EKW7317052.1 phage tail tape measure protein [Citrobacter freundii]ELO5435222.1 phage tail tape measure protein [Citrobacter freundii]MBJ9196048.1 phage tail tape measure protein [Citrobacter freundii]MBO0957447.1 phage tail tape measure protein [Citrobacter freundii]